MACSFFRQRPGNLIRAVLPLRLLQRISLQNLLMHRTPEGLDTLRLYQQIFLQQRTFSALDTLKSNRGEAKVYKHKKLRFLRLYTLDAKFLRQIRVRRRIQTPYHHLSFQDTWERCPNQTALFKHSHSPKSLRGVPCVFQGFTVATPRCVKFHEP